VTIGEIFTPHQYDSVAAAERKAARPTARGRHSRGGLTAPRGGARPPPTSGGRPQGCCEGAGDTTAARVDTAEVRPCSRRARAFDKAVLRFRTPHARDPLPDSRARRRQPERCEGDGRSLARETVAPARPTQTDPTAVRLTAPRTRISSGSGVRACGNRSTAYRMARGAR